MTHSTSLYQAAFPQKINEIKNQITLFLPLGPTQQPSHVPTVNLTDSPLNRWQQGAEVEVHGPTSKCVCVGHGGKGAGASSRVYFCHSPPTPPLRSSYRRRWGLCASVFVFGCAWKKGGDNTADWNVFAPSPTEWQVSAAGHSNQDAPSCFSRTRDENNPLSQIWSCSLFVSWRLANRCLSVRMWTEAFGFAAEASSIRVQLTELP